MTTCGSASEAERLSDLYVTLWRLLANGEYEARRAEVSTTTDAELIARAARCVKALGPDRGADAERDLLLAVAARASGGEEMAAARERFGDLGMFYARKADQHVVAIS